MGSKAYTSFVKNAEDIDHLIGTYEGATELFEDSELTPPPGLEVLFPSATVLMVSHWEAYVEDIVSEALAHMVSHLSNAAALPKEIKKIIATEIKEDLNEIAMWKLADDGWKTWLQARLTNLKVTRDRNFNTPKTEQTIDFMKRALGIENISLAWKVDGLTPKEAGKKLDGLIEVRGQIAHRGRLGVKIDKAWVSDHAKFVKALASKTGGRVNAHVREVTGKPLWE